MIKQGHTFSSLNKFFIESIMRENKGEAQTVAALCLRMDDRARADPCLVVQVEEEAESVTSTNTSEI